MCPDTAEQITSGREKHGLAGTFIADPTLAVTDLFGLRNLNTAVRPSGLPGLPIPTTLLIDSTGKVLWKDQSADYMQRSNPEYLLRAIDQYL